MFKHHGDLIKLHKYALHTSISILQTRNQHVYSTKGHKVNMLGFGGHM